MPSSWASLALAAVVALVQLPHFKGSATALSDCLDNAGNPVPWWFMYKTQGGFVFGYVDGKSTSNTISQYPVYMNDTHNPVALTRTLQALVVQNQQWFLYNDEPDVGTASSSYGHSKGVVSVDPASGTGFFLSHSTPKFPSSTGDTQFYFPATETTYGQTFLCMKLSTPAAVNTIGQHLQYIKPFVYHSTMDTSTLGKFPSILAVLNSQWMTKAGTIVNNINVGGLTMTTLGKNTAWNDALWGNLVAPTFKKNLVVESWIRGEAEGAWCPPDHDYEIVDAQQLQMPGGPGGSVQTWAEGGDHSKWAMSTNPGSTLVCIGDINRMTSQFKRGGGAVCFEHAVMHAQLASTLVQTAKCSGVSRMNLSSSDDGFVNTTDVNATSSR
jgi:deoxyribonuclease-2